MKEFYETTYGFANKKSADMEAILFGKEDCSPSQGYGPTLRPYHLFHFVTKGNGSLIIGNQRFEISAGDAFLIPAEQISYYEASASSPWSYFWAGFTGVRASQYVLQLIEALPEHYVLRGLDIQKYAAAIDKAAELKGTSAANYFTAELVLYELFFYLASELRELRRIDYSPSLAAKIKFYLDTHYMEILRMDKLAAYFDIHPNHLSRIFREAYGIAPKQYLQDLKLEKSAQMLQTTDVPVSLIAESIGFEDQHAFSRAFKNHWGVSPTEYRKNPRGG